MTSLFVDLSAVGYSDNGDNQDVIDDVVEHPVVSDADPPGIALSDKLLTAGRAGIIFKFCNAVQDPAPDSAVKLAQFLRGRGREFDPI
jgi:hypothetical protein